MAYELQVGNDGIGWVTGTDGREYKVDLDGGLVMAMDRDEAEDAADLEAQQAAEIYAENAWLRAAESATNDDIAFAAWEDTRL